MRMRCADCDCVVEAGVRVVVCADDCCCSGVPTAPESVHRPADPVADMEALVARVREALDAEDLSAFGDLLDPDVRWGAPGAVRPSCTNRDQVLAWYRTGRESGIRGHVSTIDVHGDRLVVALDVVGSRTAEERGGSARRWQVLTVDDGRISDIVGFDSRAEAVQYLGAPRN